MLRRLYESVGLIVIMHHRGKIEGRDIIRASVWIEQEIAIATLVEQVLGRPLHIAVFIQHGIAIERIRQQIQLNLIEFTTSDEVIESSTKCLTLRTSTARHWASQSAEVDESNPFEEK